MKGLSSHPTVVAVKKKHPRGFGLKAPAPLEREELRKICLEAGADDVGFVELERESLAGEKKYVLETFPRTRSLIAIVCRTKKENIRSLSRSVANLEFHQVDHRINEVARKILFELEKKGVSGLYPSMGFPMEMDRWPERMWPVSHKLVAVEAGLGHMGIHRSVIHPRFGSFIFLETLLIDTSISEYDRPLDFNPCLECKLCSSACPTGAISPDGHYSFSNCMTHTYREFMGGFGDWVENIAESKSASDYRRRVPNEETVSMWQSLSCGSNYKSVYCVAACPAGEEVIAPFLADRKAYVEEVVEPLRKKEESVYVVPGTDAEGDTARRFPHKKIRRVGNGFRPRSIKNFMDSLPLVFQRGKSEGMDVTYHFTFTGKEEREATVVVREKRLEVKEGHQGKSDIHLTADSETWLRFLAKEKKVLVAILTRKFKVRGPLKHFIAFGRCFPL